MKSPIPLYSSVLNSIGCEIDSQGLVSQSISGMATPIIIEGRRLVLPTPEVLQTLDNSKMIAFHPICENITLGNSKVIEQFRRMIQLCASTRVISLALDLVNVLTEKPESLSGSIVTLANALPDLNKKTIKALESVIHKLNGTDKTIVRIYLKRSDTINGIGYRRTGIVVFPIMDEFHTSKPNNMIYDVKMTIKEKETIRLLLNQILPNLEIPNEYSFGSNQHVAPSFDALLRVSHKLISTIGETAHKYRNYINPNEYNPELNWLEQDLDLGVYANYIPVLDGNDGTVAQGQQQATATVNVPQTQQMQQPIPSPAVMGAMNINNGMPTMQNPGVPQVQQPVNQTPFRGLGSAPGPVGLNGASQNNATRLAQQVTNPSIYANQPMYQQQMPVVGHGAPMMPMGMPMMGHGAPMIPPMMGMPGMMPPMGGIMPMGMPMAMQQPMMVQQPAMQMNPQMMQNPWMQNPMMQQQQYPQQPGGGLFKRA